MSIQSLKTRIQNATSDGVVTEDEARELVAYAARNGVVSQREALQLNRVAENGRTQVGVNAARLLKNATSAGRVQATSIDSVAAAQGWNAPFAIAYNSHIFNHGTVTLYRDQAVVQHNIVGRGRVPVAEFGSRPMSRAELASFASVFAAYANEHPDNETQAALSRLQSLMAGR